MGVDRGREVQAQEREENGKKKKKKHVKNRKVWHQCRQTAI